QTGTARLGWWRDLAQASFWWWPTTAVVVASDRPETRWDDRGRLHSIDGPAVWFADGYSLYAVHGVRVPERVIRAPESLGVQEVLNESNAEVRRVMVERFGAERLILESGACPL